MDFKWLNGQQFNHQICLVVLNMIVLVINYHLVNKNPNILALAFKPFSKPKGGKNIAQLMMITTFYQRCTQLSVNFTQNQHFAGQCILNYCQFIHPRKKKNALIFSLTLTKIQILRFYTRHDTSNTANLKLLFLQDKN